MQCFKVIYHLVYTCAECVYQENTGDLWNTLWYIMRGHCKNILPRHRKNSGQHNRCNIGSDGKAEFNTVRYIQFGFPVF